MRDLNVKVIILAVVVILVIGCGIQWVRSARAEDKGAGILTELEKNVLMRTDAQLQLLQQKFQKEAQPIVDEQTAILRRKCGEVKATPGTDCEVNVQLGTVKKQAVNPKPVTR